MIEQHNSFYSSVVSNSLWFKNAIQTDSVEIKNTQL